MAAAAVLAAAAFARARTRTPGAVCDEGGSARADDQPAPIAPTASAVPELVTYAVGYVLAMTLTLAAFALVHWRWAPPSTALLIVFALALVQIVVHFRCFLHVTLRGPARDDLQLIIFSTLIVLLMVGGTLVVLFNLRMRMM